MELSSVFYSLNKVYKVKKGERVPGSPKLLEIVKVEANIGKTTQETLEGTISQLGTMARKGGSEHEAHRLPIIQ
ncbi:MAG: hypothetical protein QXU18_10605 [Thermoplasmatales archaeon]